MKRISAILLAGVAAFAVIATLAGPVPSAAGEMTTTVGGAPMYPSKNIVHGSLRSHYCWLVPMVRTLTGTERRELRMRGGAHRFVSLPLPMTGPVGWPVGEPPGGSSETARMASRLV